MRRNMEIHARVSEPEFSGINMIASRETISRSEAVRLLIREALDRRGLSVSLADFYQKLPTLSEVKDGNQP